MKAHVIMRNYKLTTEMYSLEDYAQLEDMTVEELLEEDYTCAGCINATLVDDEVGYGFRLVRRLYGTHFLAIAEATTAATLAILDDYYAHLRSKGLA